MKGKQVFNAFNFQIVGYGLPKLKDQVVTLPVVVKFMNPLPVSIPVQRFEADIFILLNDTWQQVGRIDQPIIISDGVSQQSIETKLDIGSVLGNVLTTLQALLGRNVKVRTDVTITEAGVKLPQQQIIQDVNL